MIDIDREEAAYSVIDAMIDHLAPDDARETPTVFTDPRRQARFAESRLNLIFQSGLMLAHKPRNPSA